jgi:DNA-binding response OmpR family regulator
MKTLVIEDDLKSQCLLAKVLAERGHEVTTFENAEQAILAYQQAFYPLVFVDAGLPGMDGLQFCRWIRSQPQGERVFVMVATEPNLPQDVNQVLELGANDFLSKPYELNGLRARLSIAEQQMERFFEQQQLEQALEDETKRWTEVEADVAKLREGYESQLRERDEELAALRREVEVNQGLAARSGGDEGELAKVRDALRLQREQSERLENELVDVRNQLANRVRSQTAELLELSEQLKTYLDDRRRLDLELNQTRDDLARRVREQLSEVLRLSDELKTATLERQRIQEELVRSQREQMDQSHRAQQERDESVRRFQNEATERRQLEESLQAERDRIEVIVAERRAVEGLLEESMRANQIHQEEAGRILERLRQEEEERRGQLTAELQQVRNKVQEQQSDLSRLTAEVNSCNESLSQFEETVATHREARRHVESRWRALARFSPELNLAETPEEVARAASILTQELVGWEVFSFDAYAEHGDWVHPVLNLENSAGQVTEATAFHPGPQVTSLMRRVIEDGPQLLLRPAPSCSQTDLVVFGDRARRSSSLLYVPVKMGHHVLGFLSVRSVALDAYDGDDIETLMTIAALCAGALDRLESKGRSHQALGETASRCGSAVTPAPVRSEC